MPAAQSQRVSLTVCTGLEKRQFNIMWPHRGSPSITPQGEPCARPWLGRGEVGVTDSSEPVSAFQGLGKHREMQAGTTELVLLSKDVVRIGEQELNLFREGGKGSC